MMQHFKAMLNNLNYTNLFVSYTGFLQHAPSVFQLACKYPNKQAETYKDVKNKYKAQWVL